MHHNIRGAPLLDEVNVRRTADIKTEAAKLKKGLMRATAVYLKAARKRSEAIKRSIKPRIKSASEREMFL